MAIAKTTKRTLLDVGLKKSTADPKALRAESGSLATTLSEPASLLSTAGMHATQCVPAVTRAISTQGCRCRRPLSRVDKPAALIIPERPTPATAATATAVAAEVGTGLSLVDSQGATHEVGAVGVLDSRFSLVRIRHFNKAEPLRTTGHLIRDDPGRRNSAVVSEQLTQILVGCGIR